MIDIDWETYPLEVRKAFIRQMRDTTSIRLKSLSPELGFIYKRLQSTRQRVLNSCYKGFKRNTHFTIMGTFNRHSIGLNRKLEYCVSKGLIKLVHNQSSDEELYKVDIKDLFIYEVSPEIVEIFAQLDTLMKI